MGVWRFFTILVDYTIWSWSKNFESQFCFVESVVSKLSIVFLTE